MAKGTSYLRCPMCGWWHTLHYTLKPDGGMRGRKNIRSKSEQKVFSFIVDLDVDMSHIRTLHGAGRGSPNASIIISDKKAIGDLPDTVKAQITWQAQAILQKLGVTGIAPSAAKPPVIAKPKPKKKPVTPPAKKLKVIVLPDDIIKKWFPEEENPKSPDLGALRKDLKVLEKEGYALDDVEDAIQDYKTTSFEDEDEKESAWSEIFDALGEAELREGAAPFEVAVPKKPFEEVIGEKKYEEGVEKEIAKRTEEAARLKRFNPWKGKFKATEKYSKAKAKELAEHIDILAEAKESKEYIPAELTRLSGMMVDWSLGLEDIIEEKGATPSRIKMKDLVDKLADVFSPPEVLEDFDVGKALSEGRKLLQEVK